MVKREAGLNAVATGVTEKKKVSNITLHMENA
jgi:hypothetical protein